MNVDNAKNEPAVQENQKVAVWNFTLDIAHPVALLPRNAHPISVCASPKDAHELCAWALADVKQPVEERRFEVYTTGHPLKDVDELDFIDTAVSPITGVAYHVFERRFTPEDEQDGST